MGRYNNDSRGRDRRDRFDRGSGRRENREMHKVVCDSCGKDCQVPFRPSGDKPVYCDDCFGKNKDRERRSPQRSFTARSGSSSISKQDFEALSKKVDKILEILESKKEMEVKEEQDISLVEEDSKKTTKKEIESSDVKSRSRSKSIGKKTAKKDAKKKSKK